MTSDMIGWALCAVGVIILVALSRREESEPDYSYWTVEELENDHVMLKASFPCDGDTMTIGYEYD